MIRFGGCYNSHTFTTINPILHEFCHRLHIDTCTEHIANEIYSNAVINHRTLRKRILFPTSIYITAKRNSVPRTLTEVSSVTGVQTNKIGEYKRVIFSKYHQTIATQYVFRFG